MVTLLHTADWHLGRVLHGAHLTNDQAHALRGLVDLAREVRPDAVLVAGDVYDRAVAPPEAVDLLDDTLTHLAVELRIPVVLIAGNHDSAERLTFGARLLAGGGLHVFGHAEIAARPLVLRDNAGEVEVHALPYVEPPRVADLLGDATLHGAQAATQAMVDRIRSQARSRRKVLVGHAFVTGGAGSDSERPLSVGGAGTVDASCFSGFDYVALGHLHRPQSIGQGIEYAGSLLKYSTSEIDHSKSVHVVRMSADGTCEVERVTLPLLRDFRRVEGTLGQLLTQPPLGQREDFVVARLLDRGPVFDAIDRLRAIWPNILHIERPEFGVEGSADIARIDRRQIGERELFAQFFQDVTGEALTQTEAAAFDAELQTWERRGQEAGS